MTPDPFDVLGKIPWSIHAIRQQFPEGSTQREMLRLLEKAVTADVEWAVKMIKAEARML